MSATAKANAKLLLRKYRITEPGKYTPEEIANAEGLIIEEANFSTHLGRIVYGDGYGLIKIKADIREAGQKNFTIGHEMGHYFNEKVNLITGRLKNTNQNAAMCNSADLHPIFNSGRENDANTFASELLMPTDWFKSYTRGKKLSAELLKSITIAAGVSLSAAAMRYSEDGPQPCAVILSMDRKVKWKAINKHFPYQFIRPGAAVSELSYVYDYFKCDKIPEEGEDVPARAWFREDFKLKDNDRIFEYNIPMRRYNSVLTLLWELSG